MRILVTGGHGFVGSHLVRRLLAGGDVVRCVVRGGRLPGNLSGLGVEIVPGDLRRAETLRPAMEGVEEVYHLAARLSALSEREMLATNALGTRHLVEAALRAGSVRRFVHCSSVAVAGPSPDGRALAEDAPPRPVTWYGRSKALAERIVAAFGERGLPWTIVRPPIVYGPRDRGLLSVFRGVGWGVRVFPGTQPKRYSWVYAEDLAEALVVLGRHPATLRRTFFACHEEIADLSTFLALAAAAAGRRGLALHAPDSLLRLVAGAADVVAQATGRPGMLTRDKVHEIVPRAWVCSPQAALRDAGWRARTPLAVGVPETMRWYREHGWVR
jgi:nucleoside-diphosphate-sugar epimerase